MRVSGDPKTILAQLLAVKEGLGLCWVGNAGWLVRGEGKLIAFDPDLASKTRLHKPPVALDDLAGHLDAVLVTHEHGDHFNEGTAQVLAKKSKCLYVVPESCLAKARELGIPDARIRVATPRRAFDLLGLKVEPTHAFHGHIGQTVYHGANFADCGYVVTIAGRRVFHPGDSVLTEDQMAQRNIDVLFVSCTDHNMRIEPALRLIAALKPGWIFPQHFDTYEVTRENSFWTTGYPDELAAALTEELRARYHKLRQGEVFVVPAKLVGGRAP